MLFKFWRWRLEVKLQSLDEDKKIVFLSRELLKTISKSGRENQVDDNMLSIDIDVFKFSNEGYVGNILTHWKLPLGKITCIKWKSEQESSPASDDRQES